MRGLLRNNYYKLIASLKLILIFALLLGIVVIIFGRKNDSLLIGYVGLWIVLVPFSTAIGLGRQGVGKWKQYMLTFPIKRNSIVKSVFFTQIFVLLLGILTSAAVFALSFLIHGFSFYRWLDVPLIFSAAIALSLLTSAIFFPLSYTDSKGRTEAIGIISLISGALIVICAVAAMNIFIIKPTDIQLIGICAGMQLVSWGLYVMSYFLTKSIFSKKEF